MIYKKGTAPATSEGDSVTSAEVKSDYITLSHDVYMGLVADSALVQVARRALRNTKMSIDTETIMCALFDVSKEKEG